MPQKDISGIYEVKYMKSNLKQAEVHLSSQGRVVIPASLRRALGFQAGDVLVARKEDDRLVLEKAETIKRRIHARFADVPKQVSLAEELIAERREEASREESQ
jgi:AbrB family looped-hinge helix DNA binding protein